MLTQSRTSAAIAAVLSLILVALFAVPVVPSTFAQETKPAPTVRFVHVYSGGDPIDIYVDGQVVAQQLAFGTATEYATLTSGDHQLQIVATGADPSTALIDTTLSLDDGSATNVLIGGQDDQLDARSFAVNLDGLEPGQARLRFIQAAPDTGNVDIQLTALSDIENAASVGNGTDGIAPINNLGANTTSDYQTVVAGTYDIVARDIGSDGEFVTVPSIVLSGGNVYDVVVLGQLSSGNLTLLPLSTLVSMPCGEVLGIGTATDACVRFVHTSPDAGEVDIYLNGAKIVDAISYGTVTEFATMGTDEQQVQVVPTGQPLENAWLDELFDPSSGNAYQVAILGIAAEDGNGDNDLRLLHDQLDLSGLPPGQARVRLVNAAPDAGSLKVTRTGGAALFDGVAFGDVTDYATIDAGTTDLAATSDNGQIITSATGIEFTEGTVSDILVVGLTSTNTMQFLIATTAVEVRTGAQGTPLAVSGSSPTPTTAPGTVAAASVTAVGEGEDSQTTPTPVGAAPVTPVLTPESSPTPTS